MAVVDFPYLLNPEKTTAEPFILTELAWSINKPLSRKSVANVVPRRKFLKIILFTPFIGSTIIESLVILNLPINIPEFVYGIFSNFITNSFI